MKRRAVVEVCRSSHSLLQRTDKRKKKRRRRRRKDVNADSDSMPLLCCRYCDDDCFQKLHSKKIVASRRKRMKRMKKELLGLRL
jgi:hypothetical protein